MIDDLSARLFIRIITIIGAFIATLYIYYTRQKWIEVSQGIKTLACGILLLSVVLIITVMSGNGYIETEKILNVLTLHDFKVGFSKVIALAYVLIIAGLEILLIIMLKKGK